MRLKLLFALTTITIAAFAYFESGWFVITTDTSKAFWTSSQQNQSAYLTENQSFIAEWVVNASGFGKYELKVTANSTDVNDTEVRFNVTIFDKGNNTNLIPNYTCTVCSFKIVSGGTTTQNPYLCSNNMSAGDNCTIEWNVSAAGIYNSTFDIFVRVNYSSTTGSYKDTSITKVRIVEYPWWNTSWNCRRLINVTQNTGNNGSGIVEIRGFEPNDTSAVCDVINCTKEIRVIEISNKSQNYISNLEIYNITTIRISEYDYCSSANIRFNTTLSAGQTKQLFIYFDNPIADINYQSLNNSLPNISISNFINVYKTEGVWDWFYDSHLDFWWNESTDLVGKNARNSTNITQKFLRQVGYNPQIQANRLRTHFLERIDYDEVYWIFVHGGFYINSVNGTDIYNQTRLVIRNSDPFNNLLSDDINLTTSNKLKFAMLIASFGGDNSTTLTNCNLNNWLSKAFINKGSDCFLSFLGRNATTICPTDCDSCRSDTYTPDVDYFNECFWGNISAGKTISEAKENADFCSKTCGPSINESCTNPILVSRYTGSCNQTLVK